MRCPPLSILPSFPFNYVKSISRNCSRRSQLNTSGTTLIKMNLVRIPKFLMNSIKISRDEFTVESCNNSLRPPAYDVAYFPPLFAECKAVSTSPSFKKGADTASVQYEKKTI